MFDGTARAIYMAQLNKMQIEIVHKKEVERGREYPPFLIRSLIFPQVIKMTGAVLPEDWEMVRAFIETCRPSVTGKNGAEIEWNTLEYTHAWDWAIYNKYGNKCQFVGKLKSAGQGLIDAVDD
jgi:hypothetical protein